MPTWPCIQLCTPRTASRIRHKAFGRFSIDSAVPCLNFARDAIQIACEFLLNHDQTFHFSSLILRKITPKPPSKALLIHFFGSTRPLKANTNIKPRRLQQIGVPFSDIRSGTKRHAASAYHEQRKTAHGRRDQNIVARSSCNPFLCNDSNENPSNPKHGSPYALWPRWHETAMPASTTTTR